MRSVLATLFLSVASFQIHAAERSLTFTAGKSFLPPLKQIVVVKTGEPGPNAAKHQPIARSDKYGEASKLPGDGHYDVWWQAKDGMAVRAISKFTFGDQEAKSVKLDEHLGIINLRGDGQARVALITLAPQDDPGPDEKGHVALQIARDWRSDMVVPEGFYSIWVTPENGARSRKINDRVRVQAGKTVQLD